MIDGRRAFEGLRSYQIEGAKFLLGRTSALLADEMGLGKTVQAAVALELLLQSREYRRALIVCPAALRLNWERELERWAPRLTVRRVQGSSADREACFRLPIPVVIASYEQVRIDMLRIASIVDFDVVVLDEAQRIKNRNSDTALACSIIRRQASWALTATPVENSPDDLLAIMAFVRQGLLTAPLTRTELHSTMRPYFLRRQKAEVLPELPPIIEQTVPLEMEGAQAKAYASLWESRLELRGHRPGSKLAMLALITKLKQTCNFDEDSGSSVKADMLATIFDSARDADQKILVFSQYVETLEWLERRCPNIPSAIYHGGLSEAERNDLVDDFEHQPGPKVLFMSLRAGGVGLNLQAATTVVMFDRWWNPAVEEQAIARAHRFGRTAPLFVVKFMVEDSIEQRIANILREKRLTMDEYVVGTTSSESLPELELRELAHILDLPREVPARVR